MTQKKRYLITPEHVFELDTQAVHACSLDEATIEATKRYLETGKRWSIYEFVATPSASDEVLHQVVTENLRLKDRLAMEGVNSGQ